MKKILLINIMVIGLISLLKGQNTANLDFYVGTWKYINSTTNEEFTIMLRKTDEIYPNKYTVDCLVGAYEYKKNGNIVVSCFDKFNLQIWPLEMPIYATNDVEHSNPDPNDLYMRIYDYGVSKSTFSNSLTIVSAVNPTQIRWILKNDEGEYETSDCPPDEFSIPVDVILTKVE